MFNLRVLYIWMVHGSVFDILLIFITDTFIACFSGSLFFDFSPLVFFGLSSCFHANLTIGNLFVRKRPGPAWAVLLFF